MTEQTMASVEEPDGAPRIAVLDILRGVAILGILFMNINDMGASFRAGGDVRHFGWAPIDQVAWWLREVFANGTRALPARDAVRRRHGDPDQPRRRSCRTVGSDAPLLLAQHRAGGVRAGAHVHPAVGRGHPAYLWPGRAGGVLVPQARAALADRDRPDHGGGAARRRGLFRLLSGRAAAAPR